MRRFEYVGGTSSKFWEVDQAGPKVHLAFGRIGTAGQHQTKDLPDDSAAAAHVAKLVAEKVKKGYTEVGTAQASTPTAPPEPAPAPPSDAAVAHEPAPDAVAREVTPPKDAGPVAPAAPDDEDELVIPAAWRRLLHPRRGGIAVRPPVIDAPAAAATVRELVGAARDHFAADLAEPLTDPRFAAAVRDGDTSPLGAAVVEWLTSFRIGWQERDRVEAFADAWVAERGVVFAAAATAELAGICRDSGGVQSWPPAHGHLRAVVDTDGASAWWAGGLERVATRMRAHLAAATDGDHAAAVAALEPYRHGSIHQRIITSYLLPEQGDWVAADVAALAGGAAGEVNHLFYASLTSASQFEVVARHVRLWYLARSWSVLVSLVEGVGAGVAPTLAAWFADDQLATDLRKRVAEVLAVLPTDEAFGLLADRLDDRHVRPAVVAATQRFPRRGMRILAERAGTSARGRIAADLLGGLVRSRPDLVEGVRASLTGEAARRVESLAAEASRPEAVAADLPRVLADPPWTGKRTKQTPVVVPGLTAPDAARLVWQPGEQEAWRRGEHLWQVPGRPVDYADLATRLRQNRALYGLEVMFYQQGPADLVRPMLATTPPRMLWSGAEWIRPVVAKYGIEALPFVLHAARATPATSATLLLPFESSEIALLVADWAARLKTVRPFADVWFARHTAAAVRALVPAALGPAGAPRRTAEAALRRIAAAGARDDVTAAAGEYGEPAARAVAALLDTDPLAVLPPRIPSTPAWLDLDGLPPVPTADGAHVLPRASVGHLVTMLAMSRLDDVYGGVPLARAALEPAGLAEFAWAVFSRWAATGFPSKDGWVLDALGLIGDDETVRRLTPLVRVWPGEGGHKRAVNALGVFAAIGSDVALIHLHGISQRVKFAALREAAAARIDQIATEQGLSAEKLADRLVPDLGLDPDGTLRLDYGPRQFVVGFDEQLKPTVTENGTRRKDLPRPGGKDDPELAPAAHKRFGTLKKDVRTVATDQIRRLERAMVDGRRWSPDQFQAFFVDHPLMVHLARRLVWGCLDVKAPTYFRVAEDHTLAGVEDDLYELPQDATIGIVHPLGLGAEGVAAWTTVFADYEILQPFDQLGREVFAVAGDDSAVRFVGREVPTVKVLGLESRGWSREAAQDAGIQLSIDRPVGRGGSCTIGLDPGIIVGMPTEAGWETQRLTGISVSAGGPGHGGWRDLDPVLASELLRDLAWLTS